jgi:hypothetical protein
MKIPSVSEVFRIPSVPEVFAAIFATDPEPEPLSGPLPEPEAEI